MRSIAPILLAILLLPGCKAKPGARCFDEGSAQCDGTTMLVCRSHVWQAVACAGPKGCSVSGRFVDCDETVAVAGAPCSTDSPDGYSGCSTDHKTRLKCDKGVWRADIPCRGPKGCVVSSRFVDCDDSVALVGDACEKGNFSCSLDKKSMLVCRGGKYAVEEVCGAGACSVKGATIGCD